MNSFGALLRRLSIIAAATMALAACQRAPVPLAATPLMFQGVGWKQESGASGEFGYNGYICPKADCAQPAVALILRGSPSTPPVGTTIEEKIRKDIGSDANLRKQMQQATELASLRASVQGTNAVQSRISATRRVQSAVGSGLDFEMVFSGNNETVHARTLMVARGNEMTFIIGMSRNPALTTAIYKALVSAAK
jgi:hypothetical protein